MKKAFLGLLALAGVMILSACNQLTQYNISEQDINQALQKHDHYQKQLGVGGVVNADITLSNLTAAIGREEPNKVTLNGTADVNITSLFGPQQAQMTLKMKAQPVFNQQEGAIYLKDLEIVDSQVKPEKMDSVLKALTPYLNQSLRDYFNQKPAYVLSSDRSKAESLAKRFAKGLEVQPGKLVIPFTD